MKKSTKRVIARVMAMLMAFTMLPFDMWATANVVMAEELSISDKSSQVTTPTISVEQNEDDGKVKKGANITISVLGEDGNIEIYYTTDVETTIDEDFNSKTNTDRTINKYTEEIEITDRIINDDKTVTIKAIAVDTDGERTASRVVEETFEVQSLRNLTATPAGGEVERGQVVKLTSPDAALDGTSIYYTTNGRVPDQPYPEEGIVITEDVTIKAVAKNPEYVDSELLEAEYTIKKSKENVISGIVHNITVNGTSSSYFKFTDGISVLHSYEEPIKYKIYELTEYIVLRNFETSITFTPAKDGMLQLVTRGSVDVKAGDEEPQIYYDYDPNYSYTINSVPLTANIEYTISKISELYYLEVKYDRADREFVLEYKADEEPDPYFTLTSTVDSDDNGKYTAYNGQRADGRYKLSQDTAKIAFTVTEGRTANIEIYALSTSDDKQSQFGLYKAGDPDDELVDDADTIGTSGIGTSATDTAKLVPLALEAKGLLGGETYYIQNISSQGSGFYYVVVEESDGTDMVEAPYAEPDSTEFPSEGGIVELKCDTEGAEIYFTFSPDEAGLTDPDENDGFLYTEAIGIETEIYIRAVAIKDGVKSDYSNFHYTVAEAGEVTVRKPSANPGSETEATEVETGTKVELTADGAEGIYYTIGSSPADPREADSGRQEYNAATGITINEATTIKAVAYTGEVYSDVVTFEYTIKAASTPEPDTVEAPYADPDSREFSSEGGSVELLCNTEGAKIYYTTSTIEGGLTNPTEASTPYTDPIEIKVETYIRAVAIKDSVKSDYSNFHYTVAKAGEVAKPSANPGSETEVTEVEAGTKIELTSDGAEGIYYTIGSNPADPREADSGRQEYNAATGITINEATTIKTVAYIGDVYSDVVTFEFTVKAETTPEDPEAPEIPDNIPKAGEGLKIYFTGEIPTYTGSAIIPDIYVVNYDVETENGELAVLEAGKDYTVKVTNNVKVTPGMEDWVNAADKQTVIDGIPANKKAKITVTGKGNLSGTASGYFVIAPKDIADADITTGGEITIAEQTKVSPVVMFDTLKLGTKDYDILSADGSNYSSHKWAKDESGNSIILKGKGNYTGEREVTVNVVDKKSLEKITVVIDKDDSAYNKNLTYNGEEQYPHFKVYSSAVKAKDRTDNNLLVENRDYVVSYPADRTSAGSKKFTIIGKDKYTGSVSKSYTIKPDKSGTGIKVEADIAPDGYTFVSTGVTLPNSALTLTYNDEPMVLGKDYNVTYKNNKKVTTTKQASYTISFIGSFKGTKTVESGSLTGEFNIVPAKLNNGDDNVKAVVPGILYKKPGVYKSAPYVTVNGVQVKASNYTVTYLYGDTEIKKGSNFTMPEGQTSVELTAKIVGKGNYTSDENGLTTNFNISIYNKTGDDVNYDLSKAKVTLYDSNGKDNGAKLKNMAYTGNPIELTREQMKVEFKVGKNYVTIEDMLKNGDITLEAYNNLYENIAYVNNVNKGKATLLINCDGYTFVNCKKVTFSIAAKNINDADDVFANY